MKLFGAVPGVSKGATFPDRKSLAAAGIHRPPMSGICGTESEGAESIVLSGGYEDDVDEGDIIIYTGEGGNDPGTRRQVADQQLKRGNLALVKSCLEGLPIWVVRGAQLHSPYSPASGYRYDGLYYVDDHWRERGRSGYDVYRFRLVRGRDEDKPSEALDQPGD